LVAVMVVVLGVVMVMVPGAPGRSTVIWTVVDISRALMKRKCLRFTRHNMLSRLLSRGRSRVASSFMGSYIEDVDDGGRKLSFNDSSICQCLGGGISLGIEDKALVFFFSFFFLAPSVNNKNILTNSIPKKDPRLYTEYSWKIRSKNI
jgi:hypothetical protein